MAEVSDDFLAEVLKQLLAIERRLERLERSLTAAERSGPGDG